MNYRWSECSVIQRAQVMYVNVKISSKLTIWFRNSMFFIGGNIHPYRNAHNMHSFAIQPYKMESMLTFKTIAFESLLWRSLLILSLYLSLFVVSRSLSSSFPPAKSWTVCKQRTSNHTFLDTRLIIRSKSIILHVWLLNLFDTLNRWTSWKAANNLRFLYSVRRAILLLFYVRFAQVDPL